MKNLFGAISFGLSFALAEHAFVNMAEHKGIFRLDNPISWIVIIPLFAFGVYAFFSNGTANNEKTNG